MTRQRRAAAGSAIVLAAALALAQEKTEKPVTKKAEKAEKEPFYRKYLVPGAALDDRIQEQEKRVAANPDSADLHNDFGNLLAERRFPREAREQYLAAMKLDKTNWMAPYNLGLLEESEGRASRAMSAYEKSIDRNRGFPPSRFRLGRLYERAGRTESAIREYARALEIDPEMREVRHNPLVADTRLFDRVSVTNYEKDTARAARKTEAAWADARFRRAPVDRMFWSNEFVDPPEPEPVDSTASPSTVPRNPAPMPPRTGETRPQEFGSRPVAPPPPAPQSLQPTPVPAPPDPDNPLMLRPRPPLPTPLPQ